TDFSKEAENALKVAAQLAKRYDGEIFLIHLLELPLTQIDALSQQSELPEAMFFMKLANKKFKDVLTRDYLEGIKVHDTVDFNQTFSGISKIAKEKGVDLIVMGSHGASGFKEMFIGSNTEKVVRTSDVSDPIIINAHKKVAIYDIIFASDFKMNNNNKYKHAS